jgi:protein-disulfide isomerase
VIFGGIFWATSNKTDAPSGKNAQTSNHTEGKGTAGVTLVEYGDYECPGCGQYYQPLKDTVAKYKDKIKFQFRNFPLTQIHQNAFAGARAAEAAALQGKFWEMHDLLYQQNSMYYAAQQQKQSYSTWISATDPLAVFTSYAKELGLDTAKFKTDYASEAVNKTINADLASGNDLKVNSTPTFFLDGKQIQPSPTVDSLSSFIDDAIEAK